MPYNDIEAIKDILAKGSGGSDSSSDEDDSKGILIVNCDEETYTLDTTWQDIHDALALGRPVSILLVTESGTYPGIYMYNVESVYTGSGSYPYVVTAGISGNQYIAASTDSYPQDSNYVE